MPTKYSEETSVPIEVRSVSTEGGGVGGGSVPTREGSVPTKHPKGDLYLLKRGLYLLKRVCAY